MDSSSNFRALALRASYSLDPGAPGSGSPVGLRVDGHRFGLVSDEDMLDICQYIWCFLMNICQNICEISGLSVAISDHDIS